MDSYLPNLKILQEMLQSVHNPLSNVILLCITSKECLSTIVCYVKAGRDLNPILRIHKCSLHLVIYIEQDSEFSGNI